MADRLHCPPRPCISCPYRADHPSGVWAWAEYEKLRGYDDNPGPMGVFHCHQENATARATVCVGWLATHPDTLAVRLACATGALTVDDIGQAMATDVDLHDSGAEAADMGQEDITNPGPEAVAMMAKLAERGAGRGFG